MIGRERGEMLHQHYLLSVVDSDGDKLLDSAPLKAVSLQSAWEDALVIAFRACQGSGAVPTTINVVKVHGVMLVKQVPKNSIPG